MIDRSDLHTQSAESVSSNGGDLEPMKDLVLASIAKLRIKNDKKRRDRNDPYRPSPHKVLGISILREIKDLDIDSEGIEIHFKKIKEALEALLEEGVIIQTGDLLSSANDPEGVRNTYDFTPTDVLGKIRHRLNVWHYSKKIPRKIEHPYNLKTPIEDLLADENFLSYIVICIQFGEYGHVYPDGPLKDLTYPRLSGEQETAIFEELVRRECLFKYIDPFKTLSDKELFAEVREGSDDSLTRIAEEASTHYFSRKQDMEKYHHQQEKDAEKRGITIGLNGVFYRS